MMAKIEERNRAISLRRRGLSLREIREEIPVAKSTLSLWFKDVQLSKPQKQRLTQKKIDAALRGAARRKSDRIALTKRIYSDAYNDIRNISHRELWLMGVMLYWAEGSKEKEYRPGSRVRFTNSDPLMIKLFIKWLTDVCNIDRSNIICDIYIHDCRRDVIGDAIKHWSRCTEFSEGSFTRIYFKRDKVATKRKNTTDHYFGILRVSVRASANFNRKIAGWVSAINNYYWGVV